MCWRREICPGLDAKKIVGRKRRTAVDADSIRHSSTTSLVLPVKVALSPEHPTHAWLGMAAGW